MVRSKSQGDASLLGDGGTEGARLDEGSAQTTSGEQSASLQTTGCWEIGNGTKWYPNLLFSGLGFRFRMLLGQKIVKRELLCSCRQPPAEIRAFSGHLKSTNPDSCDVRSKNDNFLCFCVSQKVDPI